jgi:flagellar hook-basal body complex protein FliE
MAEINMNSLLVQMRTMTAQAQGLKGSTLSGTHPASFSGLMHNAVEQVNSAQKRAAALSEAFEKGDQGVDPVEVMVSLQKANISFQAATQVRNKLVSAYQEIMNMPV